MRFLLFALCCLCSSSALLAEPATESLGIEKIAFDGAIVMQAQRDDVDLQLTVVGPQGIRFSHRYAGNEPIMLDVLELGLRDGSYKYEISPVTVVPRDPASVPANLRGLENDDWPVIEVHSGTFSVIDGMMVSGLEDSLGSFDNPVEIQ